MGSHYVVGGVDNLKLLKVLIFFHTQADVIMICHGRDYTDNSVKFQMEDLWLECLLSCIGRLLVQQMFRIFWIASLCK